MEPKARYAPRTLMTQRLGALRTERSTWVSHWQQISDVLLPRSGRFLQTDNNKGQKKHNNILDNTGTRALKILGAGMMSGMTSPARPWFRLAVPDADLMKYEPVKLWLHGVASIMLDIFQRSNTYRALHSHYLELGAFGTSASIFNTDPVRLIHHYPMTIGEFMLATDPQGVVNTLYREFRRPVSEVVADFGYANCSITVRQLYDRGNLDAWVPIVHAIEPRADRDPRRLDARNMAWKSCYWEAGSNEDTYLRESGYKRFPALASRWEVTAGDIYGGSPGMEALGDLRQLQHEQLRKANAIDYMTRPPLQAPSSVKGSDVETLPGGLTYVDSAGGPQAGIRPLFETNLDLGHLLVDIQDVRDRIRGAFYADLFLMLANDNKQMTATEVAERHEEKLLALGPVLERLHNELLDPLIENTFGAMLDAGIVPPPPPELQGAELNVDFISVLAQAQRAVSTAATDRLVGNIGVIANFKPEVLDRFDADYWIEHYSDSLGVDPQMIVPSKTAALVRQARAEKLQQQEQMAMMNAGADTANKLAASPTGTGIGQGGPNALTDILSLFQGYNSPPAQSY